MKKITTFVMSQGFRAIACVVGGCLLAFLLPLTTRSQTSPAALRLLPGQSATILSDGRWLLVGGGTGNVLSSTASLWDPRTGITTQLSATLQSARSWHTATVLPDGTVFIFGGIGATRKATNGAEIFDPVEQTFTSVSSGGLISRAHHSATLLTDGTVLIAGGTGPNGATTNSAEVWNPADGSVTRLPSLTIPRQNHTATLLENGKVLLKGGNDDNSNALDNADLFDPATGRFILINGAALTNPPPTENPILVASIPTDSSVDVAIDVTVALRFSKPLRVETINADTVTLSGPKGVEQIKVVPAEGGMLAFITPEADLLPGVTYNVTVNGVKDRVDVLLPLTSIRFTTAQDQAANTGVGTRGSGGGTVQPGGVTRSDTAPSPGSAGGVNSSGTAASPGPAGGSVIAEGRTALVGRVVDTDRQALTGVEILVGGQRAVTDAKGEFQLLDPPTGDQVILVDGDPASRPGRHYPTIPLSMKIMAGKTNVLPYLPHLHVQREINFTHIDHSRETVATDPDLPGVALRIPRDTPIVGWDGLPAQKVSIRTVPADRLPVRPLPRTVQARYVYMFYFGKRGGGIPSRPVPFESPNDFGLAPGDKAELWYYDESPNVGEAPNDWRVAGLGTVSDDGKLISTDPGVGIPKFCCGAATWNPLRGQGQAGGPTSQLGQGASGGDPVDLVNGVFMFTKTDLVLPGLVPLAITRTYRSGDPQAGPFGIGTTLGFDDALQFPSSDVITYVYRGNAQTQFLLQPDGSFTNNTIPAFKGARIVVNSDGNRTLRLRDGTSLTFSNSLLIQVSDRAGNAVNIIRQMETNPTTIEDPSGRTLQLSWVSLARDRITSVSDPLGRTVSYTYDASNRLVAVTDPAGGITRYDYDSQNRMTALTDARGITFLQNTYDANSRVCRQIQADSGTFLFYYITADRVGLPESQQLLSEAASGGPVTQAPCTGVASSSPVTASVLVDPRGKPTTYWFNDQRFLTSVTDALGQTTTYTRDAATNQILSTTDPLGRQTTYTYDSVGNVTSVTRLSGTANASTTTFTYDPIFSQMTSATDPLNHTTNFGRDSSGNLISVTNPLNQTTTVARNSSGQPISITDPLNNTTQFTYERADLAAVTDPLSNTTTRLTDPVGRVLSVTNPLGNPTIYDYNALNRLTRVTDALNGVTQFGYDPNGNLLSVTDARNSPTVYTYENMDRLATRRDPLLRTESYQYDLAGYMTQFTDRKSQVTTYTYDALNRRTGVTYADGSTTAYTYDGGNRLTQVNDSIAGTITRTYDGLDRLTSETTPQGPVSYTYDAAGRRTTMTVSGQPTVNYSYDNANRLTQITQGSAATTYNYDAAGRRTSLTLPNGVLVEYAYDSASRLTSITYKQNGTTVLGNLTYEYDKNGNGTKTGGSFARTGIPSAISSTAYDAANEQTTFADKTLTYDNNGNVQTITDGSGTTTYTWNARNQLVGISGPGISASFVYDGLGRRESKTINGGLTEFLYDRRNPVQETSGTTVLANILPGLAIDEFLTRTDANSGVTSYFLADALGSPVAVTDGTGTVQTEYTYEPFGTTTLTGASNTNPFQYTGRENDSTGLYHYRARYYNPQLQRFVSEDPIEFNGEDSNLYAYVWNRPLNFSDPEGKFGFVAGGIAGGALAGGVAGAVVSGITAAAGTYADTGSVSAALADGLTGAAWGFGVGAVVGGIYGGLAGAGMIPSSQLVASALDLLGGQGGAGFFNGAAAGLQSNIIGKVGSVAGLLGSIFLPPTTPAYGGRKQ
jgi:RHS repeat-associated protein